MTPYLVVWSSLLSDDVIRQYRDTLREDNELLLLSKLFPHKQRKAPEGSLIGLQSLPCLLRRAVTHSRFLCSHAPCSAVPGTHHTRHRSRGWLCPSLPARPHSASACHPEAEWSIHSPLWGCVPWKVAHPAEVWGVVCSDRGSDSQALNAAVFYCRRRKLTGARTSSPLLYVSATAIWLSLEWVSCSYQSTKPHRCDCS